MSVAKLVELIGSSDKSWEDAAQAAVNDAIKTIRGIRGIEVTDMTAKIDSKTGKIQEYRVCVKLAFGVLHNNSTDQLGVFMTNLIR